METCATDDWMHDIIYLNPHVDNFDIEKNIKNLEKAVGCVPPLFIERTIRCIMGSLEKKMNEDCPRKKVDENGFVHEGRHVFPTIETIFDKRKGRKLTDDDDKIMGAITYNFNVEMLSPHGPSVSLNKKYIGTGTNITEGLPSFNVNPRNFRDIQSFAVTYDLYKTCVTRKQFNDITEAFFTRFVPDIFYKQYFDPIKHELFDIKCYIGVNTRNSWKFYLHTLICVTKK